MEMVDKLLQNLFINWAGTLSYFLRFFNCINKLYYHHDPRLSFVTLIILQQSDWGTRAKPHRNQVLTLTPDQHTPPSIKQPRLGKIIIQFRSPLFPCQLQAVHLLFPHPSSSKTLIHTSVNGTVMDGGTTSSLFKFSRAFQIVWAGRGKLALYLHPVNCREGFPIQHLSYVFICFCQPGINDYISLITKTSWITAACWPKLFIMIPERR